MSSILPFGWKRPDNVTVHLTFETLDPAALALAIGDAMKAKFLRDVILCTCGAPFMKRTEKGAGFWCLACDAHAWECEKRGLVDYRKCWCRR